MSEKNTDNKKTGKKRGLGRGLNALIGADVEIASEENEKKAENPVQAAVVLLDIRKIDPDSAQPRKNFDDEALEELADSIKAHGILQPLIVQKKDEDRYQIIAGERRWRAAKKAGITEIPALVKEYAPEEMLEISLIENIQRENLNPVEEAKAYRRLVEEYSLKQEEIAKRVGKNRTTITNSLRLLGLDDEVLSYLVSKDLSAGHAKALLSVRSKERQIALARKAVKEGMSVRKLEALVQEKPKQIALVEPLNPAEEIVYKDITRTLQNALGTKVSIVRGPKKSKIEIEYYSEEELERLVELLSQR
ncbi:MAG: ParB/RepB/Spo0J family partition protein [Firmicutes bacterium]|jgi:ParB family chromosome partitioning protein|nr:ParB/RepB/Spo0J family partition protein [Bacillota bacterium]